MIKPLLIILVLFFGFGNSYTQETIEELQLKSEGLKKDINQLKIEKEQKLSELEKELEPINKKLIEKDNELLVLEKQSVVLDEKINNYNVTHSQLEAYNILKDQQLYIPSESGIKKLLSFTSKLIKSDVISASDFLLITGDKTYWFEEVLRTGHLEKSRYNYDERLIKLNDLSLQDKQLKSIKKLKNKGALIIAPEVQRELKKLTGIDDEYFNLKENKQQLNTKIAICKTSQGEIQNELDSKNNEISETIEKFDNQRSELLSETSTIELEIESIIAEQKRQERIQKYNRTVKKKKIGTQVWMTKNLDVEYFRNGDPIPHCKTEEEWKEAGEKGQPAWCYYENDPNNGKKYGKLYNWSVVSDTRGLAPEGWHVPSDHEWDLLIYDLGGPDAAVKKMKSTYGWDSYEENIECAKCKNWPSGYRSRNDCPTCFSTTVVGERTVSGNGNNSSGFNGLPQQEIFSNGYSKTTGCAWWSQNHNYTISILEERYGGGHRFDKRSYNVRTLTTPGYGLLSSIGGQYNIMYSAQWSVRLIQSNKEWTLRNEEKRFQEEQRIILLKSNTIKIGDLEVMKEDLGNREWRWREAKKACANLGDGWRLPTKDELNILYENKENIGGFDYRWYWSSSEAGSDSAWVQDFDEGGAQSTNDTDDFSDDGCVRAVRDI
jgi:uncharacterized protein (TIGR02145 family)